MKFIKWFFEDQYSEEIIAAEYAEMSDEKLALTIPSQLSKVGLKCYRTEIEHRRERARLRTLSAKTGTTSADTAI